MNFLSSIIHHYGEHNADLSRTMFVLPNKRSAMFMRTYFKRYHAKAPVLMPTFVTLTSFVTRMSSLREASRSELLFVLYRCYRRVMARRIAAENIQSFDEFVFWGDLIINDFSDIDINAVDASALFCNLKRLREIESTYLTESQADAIEQIWGYRPPTTDEVDYFWKHVVRHSHDEANDENGETDSANEPILSKAFVNMWQILGELYSEYNADLRAAGIGYRGMVVADATRRVRQLGRDDFEFGHYVFVGIGAVGETIKRIFARMRNIGLADFFWDMPNIFDKIGIDVAEATAFGDKLNLRKLGEQAREFPSPEGYVPPRGSSSPIIDIIGIPSNMMQAQIAAAAITQWRQSSVVNAKLDNTAIIMPDTSLLPSLLNCLPDYPGGINITMGLPIRHTPFATLIRTIVSMHMRSRIVRGKLMLYHEDVTEVVTNPSIRRIDAKACDAILKHLEENRLYTVDLAGLRALAPSLDYVFDIPADGSDSIRSKNYLSQLVEGLCQSVGYDPENDRADSSRAHEYQVLKAYHDKLDEIFTLSEHYDVNIGENTCFKLVERLLSTDTIGMAGAPLRGLQVMGLLESRAIDFENIIVLSMNERILPRKNPLKTLIPHTLRKAYHLSTIEDVESESAYNFYRLLSRCQRAALCYDSRVAGVASGEMSRYLLQMGYMLDSTYVRQVDCSLNATPARERNISVEKDTEVCALLDLFRAPDNEQPSTELRHLSASTLKTYLACPLHFYFKHVRRLREPDESGMFMDAATYGDIIHSVLEELFMKVKGKVITAEYIRNLLNSDLSGIVARTTDKVYYKGRYAMRLDNMPGEGIVLSEVVEKIVRGTLNNEIANTPFTFLLAEEGPFGAWEIAPGLRLNFTSKIDRVDVMSDGTLRFIDYKTGSDHYYVASCENLLSPKAKERNDAMFQLLVYCHATAEIPLESNPVLKSLHKAFPETANGDIPPIRPEIYRLRSVYTDNVTTVGIGTDKKSTPIQSYNDDNIADFRQLFAEKVAEIFDPEVPFTQSSDRNNCRYCSFAQMCGRVAPEKN